MGCKEDVPGTSRLMALRWLLRRRILHCYFVSSLCAPPPPKCRCFASCNVGSNRSGEDELIVADVVSFAVVDYPFSRLNQSSRSEALSSFYPRLASFLSRIRPGCFCHLGHICCSCCCVTSMPPLMSSEAISIPNRFPGTASVSWCCTCKSRRAHGPPTEEGLESCARANHLHLGPSLYARAYSKASPCPSPSVHIGFFCCRIQ